MTDVLEFLGTDVLEYLKMLEYLKVGKGACPRFFWEIKRHAGASPLPDLEASSKGF
jgi:hypothetical protein